MLPTTVLDVQCTEYRFWVVSCYTPLSIYFSYRNEGHGLGLVDLANEVLVLTLASNFVFVNIKTLLP